MTIKDKLTIEATLFLYSLLFDSNDSGTRYSYVVACLPISVSVFSKR